MISRLKRKSLGLWRTLRFRRSLVHVHGPKRIESAPDDVIVIALVRDGAYYLDEFFAYYRALGLRHFVFFDNGSRDETIARIKAEAGTVIEQSSLSLAEFEDKFRQFPALQHGMDRWCLYVDMDEQFDFVGRDTIGISGLVRYLSKSGSTAMVSQMLEMFPDTPLSDVRDYSFAQALEEYKYFDLRDEQSFAYHDVDNIDFSWLLKDNIAGDTLQFKFGGTRKRVFDEACCLTKHPLVFVSNGMIPAPHPHCSSGVVCADISGVIRHYKFTNDPLGRDTKSVQEASVDHGEDVKRLGVMRDRPDVTLWSQEAELYRGVEPLVEAGFLVTSDGYRAFISNFEGAVLRV